MFYRPPKPVCAQLTRQLRPQTPQKTHILSLLEAPAIKWVLVFMLSLCPGRGGDIQGGLAAARWTSGAPGPQGPWVWRDHRYHWAGPQASPPLRPSSPSTLSFACAVCEEA